MLVPSPRAREDLLEEVDLSSFMIKALGRVGIETIGDLVDHNRYELMKVAGFGSITLDKIEHRLSIHGYYLTKLSLEQERVKEERTCRCHRPSLSTGRGRST